MADDLHPSPSESTGSLSPSNFRDFLNAKAGEYGLRDRLRRREEWLEAVDRLLKTIRDWLSQADPDGLLDVSLYEVARTESKLGTYDAPALKVRLGAAEADVVPIGLEVPSMGGIRHAFAEESTHFAGRVDVTDGLRKYNLYRELREGEDHWRVRDDRNRFTDLDREEFERILQDLLS